MEKLYHVQFYGKPHHSKINIKQPKFKHKNSKVKLAEKQLNKYLSMMALDKNHAKTTYNMPLILPIEEDG